MKYILGGGISGLIAGFYLNVPVIDKGGHRFPKGPLYFWDTGDSGDLLSRLGLRPRPRKVKVGYYLEKFVPPSEKMLAAYRKKTGTQGTMSECRDLIGVLDMSVHSLYLALKKRVETIEDEITRVGKRKLVGRKSTYPYDELVSTIPLPELLGLIGIGCELEYSPIHFVEVDTEEELVWENEFDYIYLLDEENPFYRVTKKDYPRVVFESISPSYYFGRFNVSITGHTALKYGKIISGAPPDLSGYRIKLLGRFSEWNPSVRMHDAIKKVREWSENG